MRDSLNPWKREKGFRVLGEREEGFRVFILFNKFCCFSDKKRLGIFWEKKIF
jgi:hypothetical protein